MEVLNIIVLLGYTALNNFYLYELFWGGWDNAAVKGFFYLFTTVFILFFTVNDIIGYGTNIVFQLNIICKFTLLLNFIIFAFAQLNIMPKPIDYLFLLNGSVFAISIIILTSGLRHGTFKD